MQKNKKHNKRKHIGQSFYSKLSILFGAAIIIILLYNTFQISSVNPLLEQNIEAAKKAAIPAKIELLTISAQSCNDCYGISYIVDTISLMGVNITKTKEVEFNSEEGNSLIKKYGIKNVPTIIVTGEINKSNQLSSMLDQIGEKTGEDYVVTKLNPPFIDMSTGLIKGVVSLKHLKNENCEECYDLSPLVSQMSNTGMKIGDIDEISINSKEGKELIKKYNIQKIPAIILGSEIEVYPELIKELANVGNIESDGVFVTRFAGIPYYDILEKRIKGLVTMTVLLDKSCDECYNPNNVHKLIFQKMGIVFKDEKNIDISSLAGKELIDKFSIEKVPTVLLSGDVSEYPGLVDSWKDVGTVEDGGVYVFRKLEIIGQVYRDLVTNNIITPTSG